MAIIKQYDDYFGKVKHRVQIKCSGATGIFSIALPPEVHGAMGEKVEAKTLEEVQVKYRAAAIQYKVESTKIEKVLIVKFTDDISFANNVSFSLECGVFEKLTWPGISDSEKYEPVESTIPEEAAFEGILWPGDVERNGLVFAWTAEKEQFLASMCEAFMSLITKMREFTKSKKALIGLMNTQKLLPSWPTE